MWVYILKQWAHFGFEEVLYELSIFSLLGLEISVITGIICILGPKIWRRHREMEDTIIDIPEITIQRAFT
jgi:hypothetical protein